MNIIVVGCGYHARKNILPLFKNEHFPFRLIGLQTRSKEKLGQISFVDKKVLRHYEWRALFNLTALDCVYVALPNAMHFDVINFCSDRNLPIICEKSLIIPWSEQFEKLKKMKVRVFEAFMYRYHPLFDFYSELIKSKVSKIKCVRMKFEIPHLDNSNIRYSEKLGGGALLDVGAYVINAFLHYSQKPKLLKAQVNFSKLPVDIDGDAIFLDARGFNFCLSWGFGKEYANEISVELEDYTLKSERFFSKDVTKRSIVRKILKNSNSIVLKSFDPVNHFEKMFEQFHSEITLGKNSNILEIQQMEMLDLI